MRKLFGLSLHEQANNFECKSRPEMNLEVMRNGDFSEVLCIFPICNFIRFKSTGVCAIFHFNYTIADHSLNQPLDLSFPESIIVPHNTP